MKREWMGAARLGVVLFLLYLAIHYWGALSSLLLLGLGAAFPLVLGAVIAYAVNILMSLYEGWYFPDTKSPFVIKSRRPVCLLLAFASLIAIVFLLIRMILPELLECTLVLIQEVVPMLEKLSENLDLSQFFSISSTALADGSINWKEVITSITQWLVKGVGGVMGSVLSLVSATVSPLRISRSVTPGRPGSAESYQPSPSRSSQARSPRLPGCTPPMSRES